MKGLVNRFHEVTVLWEYDSELVTGERCTYKLKIDCLLKVNPRNSGLTFHLVCNGGVDITGGERIEHGRVFLIGFNPLNRYILHCNS